MALVEVALIIAVIAALSTAVYVLLTLKRRLSRAEEEKTGYAVDAARLHGVIESSPDAFVCWDPSDGKMIASPRAAEIFDLSADAQFADLVKCFCREAAERLNDAVAELRQRGAAFDLPMSGENLDTKSGKHFRASGTRIAPSGDRPLDYIWLRDVSEEIAGREGHVTLIGVLVEERDRLRRILDALPMPVWQRNGDLSLSYCNKAYGTAVDAESDRALAESLEIAAGLIADHGRALASRAFATRMPQSESHHIVIDGKRHLMEFTEVPSKLSKDGSCGEMIGFARDFSDLESAHNELSRHIAAHGEVLEGLNIAIAIFGPDKKLKFFNSAYARLWELDQTWLTTEPEIGEILEVLHEKRRLPEYADFQAFKKEQRGIFTSLIEAREELVHLPDNTTLRSLIAPHPFGGLIFSYEDVTDRLALERSFNTLADVQRETLDNLYEGIAVFGSDGRLKLSNPAYARIWNLPEGMLEMEPHVTDIADHARKFCNTEDDWLALRDQIVRFVTDPKPFNGHLERGDGSILNYACVPLPDGNVLFSYIDVTDRFRVEQALRERAEAMETAARLKSEFIANVSYELRTPLNTIIGFAEILANQYFGKLSARQMEYSKGILESSQRLLMLINDILDLATIEAGYMKLDLDNVEVRSMLVGAMGLISEWAQSREITLRCECKDDVGSIYADARRIKQAVFNLLSNAIKFTLSGGTIVLSAERLGEEVHINVSDSGIGIPEDQHERVFEMFERGTPPGAIQPSGAGLGLSLVKNLVELHKGRIKMMSTVEKGTSVTLILPARSEPIEIKEKGKKKGKKKTGDTKSAPGAKKASGKEKETLKHQEEGKVGSA